MKSKTNLSKIFNILNFFHRTAKNPDDSQRKKTEDFDSFNIRKDDQDTHQVSLIKASEMSIQDNGKVIVVKGKNHTIKHSEWRNVTIGFAVQNKSELEVPEVPKEVIQLFRGHCQYKLFITNAPMNDQPMYRISYFNNLGIQETSDKLDDVIHHFCNFDNLSSEEKSYWRQDENFEFLCEAFTI